MFNEIKFSEYVETGKLIDKINLPDFLKVYLNHRPPFGNTMDGIQNSFNVLGYTNSEGKKAIRREDFLNLLLTKGKTRPGRLGAISSSHFPAHRAEVGVGRHLGLSICHRGHSRDRASTSRSILDCLHIRQGWLNKKVPDLDVRNVTHRPAR